MEGILNAGSLLVRKSAGQEGDDYRPQEKQLWGNSDDVVLRV